MRETLAPHIMSYLTKIAYAIGFLLVGIMIAKIIAGKVVQSITSHNPAPSTKKMAEVVHTMIMVGVTIMLTLSSVTIMGINVTLIMGGLGLAIGYAMEEVLGNIFASIMIITSKQYAIGDTVKIGGNINILGTIQKVTTRTTVIQTYDKQHVIIPNLTMIRTPVIPYTQKQILKCTGTITIDRHAHITPIKTIIIQAINNHPATMAQEYTTVLLSGYTEAGAEVTYHYYFNPSNEAGLGRFKYISQINQNIHQTLTASGITIPRPQRVLDTSKAL